MADVGDTEQDRAVNLFGAVSLLATDAIARAHEHDLGAGRGHLTASATLVALATFTRLTVDQVGSLLGISHSGATRVLDRLADHGWIVRAAGPADGTADRRVVPVTLTVEGQAVAQRLLADRQVALEHILAPLAPAERAQLAGLLDKIVRHSVADDTDLRRVCRQCDHTVCLPCPAVDRLESAGPPAPVKPPPAGRS